MLNLKLSFASVWPGLAKMVGPARPLFVLFGSSIVQLSFGNGGWGSIIADLYSRRVYVLSLSGDFWFFLVSASFHVFMFILAGFFLFAWSLIIENGIVDLLNESLEMWHACGHVVDKFLRTIDQNGYYLKITGSKWTVIDCYSKTCVMTFLGIFSPLASLEWFGKFLRISNYFLRSFDEILIRSESTICRSHTFVGILIKFLCNSTGRYLATRL